MAAKGMEQRIIDQIQRMSGGYSPYVIFTDWVAMMALSIQNSCSFQHDCIWIEREKRYLKLCSKYSPGEIQKFCEMLEMLVIEFDNTGPRDILGEIYMRAGCGNKNTGQFFTPFHVSELCASMCQETVMDDDSRITINEPSVGGGGMIIAAAKALWDRGINYQRRMDVVAQDLDWNGVYMAYVQLSLLGIKARVAQGDTLREPYAGNNYPPDKVLKTPAYMGLLI